MSRKLVPSVRAPFGVAAVKAVATGLVFEVVIITGGLLGGAVAWYLGRRGRGESVGVSGELEHQKATAR